MKEALHSSETLVNTRVTRRNIPEDTILHSHRLENLESDIHTRYIDMIEIYAMLIRSGFVETKLPLFERLIVL
jgi:hypothetical protein